MSRVGPTTRRRLLVVRDYLAARKVEVREDLGNTARGLAGMVATLDLVLASHDGREDALDLPECLDVSGLTTTLPRACGNRARRFDPHALALPVPPPEAVDASEGRGRASVPSDEPDAPQGTDGASVEVAPAVVLTLAEVERLRSDDEPTDGSDA